MAKAKKSSDGSKVSKSAFVRQHPSLSPAEVEAKAKEAGMTLSAAYVSNIRSADKAKGGVKKTRGPKKGATASAKAEAAAPQKRKTGPTPGGGPSKSDFIRAHSDLSVKDLVAAGAAKGIELSPGLIYGVRAAKGPKASKATGAKRGRRPGTQATSTAAVTSSSRGAAGDPVKEILRIAIASAGIDGAARLISDAHKRISMIA